MKFYFCERCGKRLTEVDLEQGRGRDKKLTGVYCTDCATGVMTVESLPLDMQQAREILRAASSGNAAPSATVATKETPQARLAPAKHGVRPAAKAGSDSTNGLLIAGLAVPVLLVIAWAVLSRGDVAAPKQPKAVTPTTVAAEPANPEPAKPTPQTPPTVAQASPTPAPAATAAPANPEEQAEAALDLLRKNSAADATARIAQLEEFLAKHGDTIIASRARVMLAELKAPPVANATPPANNAAANVAVGKDGLVIHWTFDEGKGDAITDATGRGCDGTLKGATWTEGRYGTALMFSGAEFVEFKNFWPLVKNDSKGTLAAWVYIDAPFGYGTILTLSDLRSSCKYITYGVNAVNAIYFSFRKVSLGSDPNCVAIQGTRPVPTKAWAHIAVVSDGTQYQLYIDGEPDACTASTQNLGKWFSELPAPREEFSNYIGKMERYKETRHFFKGKIDDLRVYNRPLTAEELKALVNTPPKPAKPQ